MPYYELKQAGINADADLKFRYTGSHPATAKAVESGAMDAGALDESVYNSMIADGKLDNQFVVVPDGAVWPGSHEASHLVRRSRDLIAQGVTPTVRPVPSTAKTRPVSPESLEVR